MVETIIIDSDAGLAEAAAYFVGAKLISLDTETSPKDVAKKIIKSKREVPNPSYRPAPDGSNVGADMIVETFEEEVFDDDINKVRGLDPFQNRLRLFQISDGKRTYVVKCDDIDLTRLRVFQPIFDQATVVGANLVFDMKQLLYHTGVQIPHRWDLSVIEQALTAGLHSGNSWFAASSLKSILKRYCDIDISKEVRQTFGMGGPITQEQIEYAAGDVHYLLEAYEKQRAQIEENNMQSAADLENNALFGIVQMELAGMPISVEKWKKIAEDAETRRRNLYDGMQELFLPKHYVDLLGECAKSTKVVDPNSHLDLRRSLQRLGLVITDTRDQTLKGTKLGLPELVDKAKKPVRGTDPRILKRNKKLIANQDQISAALDAILDYRDAEKQRSTYGYEWLRWVNPVTSRVHTSIRPYGAETGRNSSANPNLQNVPVRDHPEYRDAFCLDEYPDLSEHLLIVSDWAGCELRVIAYLSQDPTMLQAFNSVPEKDLHILAASIIFRRDYDELFDLVQRGDKEAKKLRAIAKNINFGIAYGIGPRKVSEQVEIPFEQAKEALNGWRRAFPVANDYLNSLSKLAWENQVLYGITNHRRFFVRPDPNLPDEEYRMQKGGLEREARNWLIQNANGAMIKAAERLIPERIAPYNAKLLLVVHDETISTAHEMVAEDVSSIILETMIEIGNSFLKEDASHQAVKMGAEIHLARHWIKG